MEEFRDEICKWIIDTGIKFDIQGGIPCPLFTKEFWIDNKHLKCLLETKLITEL